MTENDKQLYQLTQAVTRIANYIHEILLLVKKDQEESKKRWEKESEQETIMITKEEYRNIMTDVYRKIITAVNIETGDDGAKAHKVLETFHELLKMDNEQYAKQQKFYG